MSSIHISVHATVLHRALEHLDTVRPAPITHNAETGYLFVVRPGEPGTARCLVYSRDKLRVARAEFVVDEVVGEGAFIYPSELIDSVRLAETTVAVSASEDDEGGFVVHQRFAGSEAEMGSFDSRLIRPCDQDLEGGGGGYAIPVPPLREALKLGRAFVAKATDHRVAAHFQGLQIIDASEHGLAKGDGYLFASNGIQAIHIFCDAFRGMPLHVHGQHLPHLARFLADATGEVRIRVGAHMTYAIDATNRVLGWAHHHAKLERFAHLSLDADSHVTLVPRALALGALQYIRALLPPGRAKVAVIFNAETASVTFRVAGERTRAASMQVPMLPKPGATPGRSFAVHANASHLFDLFEDVKANDAEFRVALEPDGHSRVAYFRTVDEFWLDGMGKVVAGSGVANEPGGAVRCVVTRVVPSMA
jgi:hypothetical protein